MLMDGLLIATGFTGALTLAWFIRLMARSVAAGEGVSVHFGPAAAEAIALQIGQARREVVLVGLEAPSAVARPLADAKGRGVTVDALIDPDGDCSTLERAGVPVRSASRPTPPGLVVVIDDRIVLVVGPGTEGDSVGQVVVSHGPETLIQTCRQHFAAFHPVGQVAPTPQPTSAPVLVPAPNYVTEPSPVVLPAPEPVVVPAPVVAEVSMPTYTTPPTSSPVDDLLAAVARSTSSVQEDDMDEDEEIEEDDPTAPPVSAATAELFARLRQEVALSGQEDSEENAA